MTYSVNQRAARATRRVLAATAVSAALFTVTLATSPAGSSLFTPHAQALSVVPSIDSPLDPGTEAGQQMWENAQARSTDPRLGVSLSLSSLRATSEHATATLDVKNDSRAPASNLGLRVMWQPPAADAAAIRVAQLANYGEYPAVSAAVAVPGTIAPGESKTITVSLSKDAASAVEADAKVTTPQLFTPGSHPIMFALSGDVQGPEQQEPTQQLAAVARTTMSVVWEKKEDQAPARLTFLWPLAAETDVLGGGMGAAPTRGPLYLRNEDLADELGDGGRLRMLLDSYRTALDGPQGGQIKQASCLAIDPELLDTVERMTGGYRVGTTRPAPVEEPKRLRDSWGDLLGGDDEESVAGTGSNVAKSWLDDLRALVNQGCSVALPYAGADINTIAATGDDWLGVHAFGQGPQIIHRVLGVWPIQDMVIPDAGYVSPDAARVLAAGATQGRNGDLSDRFERVQNGAPVFPRTADVTTLVADNTLVTDTPAPSEADGVDQEEGTARTPAPRAPIVDLSPSLPQQQDSEHTARAVGYSGNVGTALRATGTRPEVAAYSNPTQRYDLSADSSAARMLDATSVINEELSAGQPVVAVPPALWSITAQDAEQFLGAMGDALASERATATPLTDVVAGPTGIGRTTVPYTDPGTHTDTQIASITEYADYLRDLTLFMRNDQAIALTREAFTRPLYDDLTRATTSYRMREREQWGPVRMDLLQRTQSVEEVVSALRRSVSLLPPGNVFTRTSDSSPLLVVARNGLPLPVPVAIDYSSKGEARINLDMPNATETLPAKGSITVSMTTAIEEDASAEGTTDLRLWLASPNGTAISAPVDLRVQSAPGLSTGTIVALLALLAGIGVLGKFLWDRRSGRYIPRPGHRRHAHPQRLDLGKSDSYSGKDAPGHSERASRHTSHVDDD